MERKRLRIFREEKGQSLVEVSAGLVFLLLIAIIVFEAGIVFSSYIALLNAAREGAMFASSHSWLDPDDTNPAHIEDYQKYERLIKNEARNGGLTDMKRLIINPPVSVDKDGNGKIEPGEPIEVSVQYQVVTFTSTISLPYFGRLGLPNYWPVTAKVVMPIR